MDERAYYSESQTTKPAVLNCPYCRSAETYELRTVICAGRVVVRDGALVMREQFLAESNRSIALRGEKVKP